MPDLLAASVAAIHEAALGSGPDFEVAVGVGGWELVLLAAWVDTKARDGLLECIFGRLLGA